MDVIWNITQACPWDCEICCVSAIHVCNTTKHLVKEEQKQSGQELSLVDKFSVLKILADQDVEIDFSGGDPLYYEEDMRVIEQATRWFPSEKICISMTGNSLNEERLELIRKVGAVEFTLDNLPNMENKSRPHGFNRASMIAIIKCQNAGAKVRAVTVLYSKTMTPENLGNIYRWFCDNKIPEWELLRFYPVGRSLGSSIQPPTNSEYLETMKFIRGFRGYTKIFFQHSLRVLEGNFECPAVKEAIGILPDGQVVACAWAIDSNCLPLPEFRLGKLPEDNLDKIINDARKRQEYVERTKFCRTIACLKKQ